MTGCVTELITVGLPARTALGLVGYPRSSWYRHRRPAAERPAPIPQAERVQPHALSHAEIAEILAWLGQERFANLSVQQVYWTCDLRSLRWLMRIGGAVR